jgi:hypothetical protein
MVITCDNERELLMMERRVSVKASCTVRGKGKAGNTNTVGLPIPISQNACLLCANRLHPLRSARRGEEHEHPR